MISDFNIFSYIWCICDNLTWPTFKKFDVCVGRLTGSMYCSSFRKDRGQNDLLNVLTDLQPGYLHERFDPFLWREINWLFNVCGRIDLKSFAKDPEVNKVADIVKQRFSNSWEFRLHIHELRPRTERLKLLKYWSFYNVDQYSSSLSLSICDLSPPPSAEGNSPLFEKPRKEYKDGGQKQRSKKKIDCFQTEVISVI